MVLPPLKRYTITFTVATNWTINHILFFQEHQFANFSKDPLIEVKKNQHSLPNVPIGTILSLKYKDENGKVHFRGYGNASESCFSNVTSAKIYVGKIVDVKIPSFGKIQITGCLDDPQAYKTIQTIWKSIQEIEKRKPGFVTLPPHEPPKAIYNPVMNNVSIHINFEINRKKLQTFLYRYQGDNFLLPVKDERYAGTKIEAKINDISHIPIVQHRFLNGKWYSSLVSMNDFLALLTSKSRKEELMKKYQHVILMFHSGKFIYIAPRFELMPDFYRYFLGILQENRDKIEETCQNEPVKMVS